MTNVPNGETPDIDEDIAAQLLWINPEDFGWIWAPWLWEDFDITKVCESTKIASSSIVQDNK